MKLQKAIEILTTYMKGSDEAEPVDFDDAIKLLIEAGKRINVARLRKEPAWGSLLPGETKD